ncbi:PDZ domain-containing protein 8 [Liparis tanakae]|uniref:PDZ domain-containing protein 8 n=1 Tax=Liparis tanakae TaxID=230148 RepID=A0A4Z2G0H7_9TELE|nr:PDZ domain-containing protein 8 [Liparis tanakae]
MSAGPRDLRSGTDGRSVEGRAGTAAHWRREETAASIGLSLYFSSGFGPRDDEGSRKCTLDEEPLLGAACDLDLSIQDSRLVEGRLKVTLIECSRLFILGSYDRETYVHCTLELSSHQWKEKTRTSIKRDSVVRIKGYTI